MATLQVKGVPDELHAALRARAADEGTTVSELVLAAVRADLAKPSLRRWAQEQRDLGAARTVRPDIDVAALMDEVRGPNDR